MNLSSLLAIAGGAVGLATSDDFAGQLASGAAIVSGAAGLAGQTNLAKIAGIAALGAGAYDAFTSSSDAAKTSDTSSNIDSTLKGASGNLADPNNLGGASGTGQSFSDAKSSGEFDPNAGVVSADPTSNSVATSGASSLTPTSPGISNTVTKPSLLDSAKSAVGGLGGFVHDNKDLISVAGGALNSAFGTGAQQISLLKSKLAFDQAQIDRRNALANNLTGLSVGVSPNPKINALIGG